MCIERCVQTCSGTSRRQLFSFDDVQNEFYEAREMLSNSTNAIITNVERNMEAVLNSTEAKFNYIAAEADAARTYATELVMSFIWGIVGGVAGIFGGILLVGFVRKFGCCGCCRRETDRELLEQIAKKVGVLQDNQKLGEREPLNGGSIRSRRGFGAGD